MVSSQTSCIYGILKQVLTKQIIFSSIFLRQIKNLKEFASIRQYGSIPHFIWSKDMLKLIQYPRARSKGIWRLYTLARMHHHRPHQNKMGLNNFFSITKFVHHAEFIIDIKLIFSCKKNFLVKSKVKLQVYLNCFLQLAKNKKIPTGINLNCNLQPK